MKLALVMIMFILMAGTSQATIITVCSHGCNYSSIQEAVYAAKMNDTIELQSGTYNESVYLTKELKFRGRDTGKGDPVVMGNLYKEIYLFDLKGFGFNSVKDSPDVLSSDPNSTDYWMALAKTYYSTNSNSKALEAVSNALKKDPRNVIGLNQKGLILYNQGRIEEAMDSYNQALKIDPSFGSAWYNVGCNLYNEGKYQQALACLDNATNADPRNALNWVEKSLILSKLGRYDDALIASKNAVALNPSDSTNWASLAAQDFVMGKYEDALAAINKAIDLSPNSATLWQVKAVILKAMPGHITEANNAIAKANELAGVAS